MGNKAIKGKNDKNLSKIIPKTVNNLKSPNLEKRNLNEFQNLKSGSPKLKKSINVSVTNPASQYRIANKKSKIIIVAKPIHILNEQSEMNILHLVKKNNHEFEDKDLINDILTRHFFMRTLEKEARIEVIKEMTLCEVNKDDILFKQGSIGNYFYIVKEGEFELLINGVVQRKLTIGDSFGELALLHGVPRSGTVQATMKSLVYCLERRNFRKIVDHINATNFEENKRFINMIGILSNIEDDLKSVLASQIMKQFYEESTFIVKEGDMASCLFIIIEGEVECVSKGKVIRNLVRGDFFGEKSVLLESTRTMDVIAKTHCVLYSISVETLKSMVGDKYKDVLFINFIKMAFQQSKVFNKINKKLIENAYDCFTVKDYSRFETIVPVGQVYSSKIIIVIEGNVYNKKFNQIVARRGDILFEDYVSKLSKDKNIMDLVAEPDCLVMEANTEDFIRYFGGTFSFKDLYKKSNLLDSLIKIPLFKNFPHKKIETLSNLITIEKFENGKKIIRQGENDDKFYIVKQGKVDIFVNSSYVRTLNVNESFGEKALFFNEPRTATAQANGQVECYVILSKDFKSILEDNLAEFLKNRFYLQDNSIELKDLDFVRELGQGSFGSVVQVRHRKNHHLYAIKALSKKQIDFEQLHVNLELERGILLKIDHPFIVKLVKTLKTDNKIFFLMEYIRGKELFEIIREIGLLNKTETIFYSASIMIAIDYLHERRFIYRDIKPENVMVCENGFIKLIDFGTVKEIIDRTTTIIGTPHYMSPEVILGEGYSFQVDFWSIAVCMYEFVCGCVPFGESADEPMEVYLSIVNNELNFPKFVKDKEFITIIEKMLSKSPITRLSKFSQIKSDPYFLGTKWEDLISFSMDPPFLPKLSVQDTKNTNVAFINYVRTMHEWKNSKVLTIDKKSQLEYDTWFKNF